MGRAVVITILLLAVTCSGASADSSVWKAQKGSAVIYLGGTCHLLRENDYPLPPEFTRAYRAADSLVFETDIGRLQEPATREKLLAKARYGDNSTLEEHLSPRTYGELSAFWAANGIPPEPFRQMKPAMLMLTLTLMELEKLGVNQQGVDQYFYALARKEKKPVEGLESVDTQLDYVLSMADGNEDNYVSYGLREMADLKGKFAALVSAWRRGDARQLDELMIAELKADQPQLYKKLITERNRAWLPMILAAPEKGKTKLFLVGAGHLVGADGIIAALRKAGYLVEKL